VVSTTVSKKFASVSASIPNNGAVDDGVGISEDEVFFCFLSNFCKALWVLSSA
jgi:hypothetical protein